jgi:hypothetical protein
MEKITSVTELKNAIKELEYKQAMEWPTLKENFRNSYENFKPVNILKNTFKEIVSSPEIRNNAIKAAIGFTVGILVKRVLLGKINNPLTKLLVTAVDVAFTNTVAKNSDKIKSIGNTLIGKIINLTGNSKKNK